MIHEMNEHYGRGKHRQFCTIRIDDENSKLVAAVAKRLEVTRERARDIIRDLEGSWTNGALWHELADVMFTRLVENLAGEHYVREQEKDFERWYRAQNQQTGTTEKG